MVHWNGRLHGKLCSVLGRYAHFVAPRANVEHLWQFSSQEVSDLSDAILVSDMAAEVPAVPYDPIPCATTIAARESMPGQALVVCRFEGCKKSMAVRLLRGHVNAHLLLGHRWEGQGDMDVDNFCVFCGNCDGVCQTTVRHAKVTTNCPMGYDKLKFSMAKKGSASYPCTSVPVMCGVRTCQKWVCTYSIAAHMESKHANLEMLPPYFRITEEEKRSVLRAFDSRQKAPSVADAPLPPVPAPPANSPAAIASSNSSSNSSSDSGSSSNSSSSSGSSSSSSGSSSSSSSGSSSSTSGTGSASSASDFVPSEGVSDVGQSNVATRSGPRKRVRTMQSGRGRKKGHGKAKRTAEAEWSDSD